MLAFLGDIHGVPNALTWALDKVKKINPEVTAIIQVGDFGFYPNTLQYFKHINPYIPVFAIDGNHEYYPLLEGITEVTEIVPNIFYVPRGTVMELDGRKIGFCGGASSVDRQIRLKRGLSWYPEEVVTRDDIAKFVGVEKVDILVTHTPPQSIIDKHFSKQNLLNFGLSESWIDPSAVLIEHLWNRFNRPELICGHMHRSIRDKNVTVLNINELCYR